MHAYNTQSEIADSKSVCVLVFVCVCVCLKIVVVIVACSMMVMLNKITIKKHLLAVQRFELYVYIDSVCCLLLNFFLLKRNKKPIRVFDSSVALISPFRFSLLFLRVLFTRFNFFSFNDVCIGVVCC